MTQQDDPKSIEYYAAQVSAWFQTSLERDKSLLSLSTAGIGVLIVLLTRQGQRSICEAVLYILAIVAFAGCALMVLTIFGKNQEHLEAEIRKTDNRVSRQLAMLDKLAISCFGIGIFTAVVIGVLTAIESTH